MTKEDKEAADLAEASARKDADPFYHAALATSQDDSLQDKVSGCLKRLSFLICTCTSVADHHGKR